MKKTLITMAMLVVMAAGAMMLSSFATSKQDAKAESSQIQINDDWELFRTGVAYCDADTDKCMGTGDVYVNTNTYQARIRVYIGNGNYSYYDLTEYTRKDGYNYRFWHSDKQTYYYVYINLR